MPVVVTENGRRRKVAKRQAIIKQLVNRSTQGDLKAMQMLLGAMQDIERREEASPETTFNAADEKVLAQLKARLLGNGPGPYDRKPDSAEYDAVLRQDFASFAARCFHDLTPQAELAMSWHIEVIAAKLAAVRERRIRRLIINLPPRHLKSLLASIAFPTWCLGHDPSVQLLCVSYAQDLADKLARDCRSIMTSAWYRRIFRTRLAAGPPGRAGSL